MVKRSHNQSAGIESVDLSKSWQIIASTEQTRRDALYRPEATKNWKKIDLPFQWQSDEQFAGFGGPMLYQCRFENELLLPSRRAWMSFEGVFYQADFWLDGDYLGDREGYFFPHSFEVTDHLRKQTEHTLLVSVSCAHQGRENQRNFTGTFQNWPYLDQTFNPGGIWRSAGLRFTGPVRIESLQVLPQEASAEEARVMVTAKLDALEQTRVRIRTRVANAELIETHLLSPGTNELTWRVIVYEPKLWWPHLLGDSHLEDLEVCIWDADIDEDASPSDRATLRTGLREVHMDNFQLTINAERLFAKGANLAPVRTLLGNARESEIVELMSSVKEANLDLVRLNGHIAPPALYDTADQLGLLIWQDLPLKGGFNNGAATQAAVQAKKAVAFYGHHPSIAVWSASAIDDPVVKSHVVRGLGSALRTPKTWLTPTPAVTKKALKSLRDADPTRPTVAASGSMPTVRGSSPTALWIGWSGSNLADLAPTLASWPRLGAFPVEFGAATHSDQKPNPLAKSPDDEELSARNLGFEDSLAYQSALIKIYVETLRRLKYRPTGGFAHFFLNDPVDQRFQASMSLVNPDGSTKPGYEALKSACAPVIVVADQLNDHYHQGDPIALDIHVINDLREPITSAVVTASLEWAGGSHSWSWRGSMPLDSVVRVGTIAAVVEADSGSLDLKLTLEHNSQRVENQYQAAISPRGRH